MRLERAPGSPFLIFHSDEFKELLHAPHGHLTRHHFSNFTTCHKDLKLKLAQFLPYKNHELKQVQLKEVIWQLRP